MSAYNQKNHSSLSPWNKLKSNMRHTIKNKRGNNILNRTLGEHWKNAGTRKNILAQEMGRAKQEERNALNKAVAIRDIFKRIDRLKKEKARLESSIKTTFSLKVISDNKAVLKRIDEELLELLKTTEKYTQELEQKRVQPPVAQAPSAMPQNVRPRKDQPFFAQSMSQGYSGKDSALANVEGLSASSIPEEFSKYEKMLKMGIPLGAIEQKMKTNGVNSSKIASYLQLKQGKQSAVSAPKIPEKIKKTLEEYRTLKNILDRKSLILAMKENDYNPLNVFNDYSNSEYNSILTNIEEEKARKAKQEEEAKEAKARANAELQKKLSGLSKEEQAEYARLKPFEQSMFFSPLFRKAKDKSSVVQNIDYTSQERANIEKIDRMKKEKIVLESSIKTSLAVKPPIPAAVTKRILDNKAKLKDIEAQLLKLDTPELRAKKNAMLKQAYAVPSVSVAVPELESVTNSPVNNTHNKYGNLPPGWVIAHNNTATWYENSSGQSQWERPVFSNNQGPLPLGWKVGTDGTDKWYENSSGHSQWERPSAVATKSNELPPSVNSLKVSAQPVVSVPVNQTRKNNSSANNIAARKAQKAAAKAKLEAMFLARQ